MPTFAEKQAQIDSSRSRAIARYPKLWARLLSEWQSPGVDDRVWLTYSANYLMRTRNIRWALDPLAMHQWLDERSKENLVRELETLSFVLLTHEHDDHLDLGLIRALRELPIRWVVPEAILPQVLAETNLPMSRVLVPKSMIPIQIEGITIWPFDGLHWDYSAKEDGGTSPRGVPAVGYLVEFSGKRWLFPGDVRMYSTQALPLSQKVDVLFAHVWLGRGSALTEPPPLLEPFCRFCVESGAPHVVLAHLEEYGRDANDYWDADHVAQVRSLFKKIAPRLLVTPAYMGDSVKI